MSYINFTTKADNSLTHAFLDDIKIFSEKRYTCGILHKLIKSKKLKCSFYTSTIDNCYLVMIVSYNDRLLMDLGLRYGLPRGYPIIWRPTQFVRSFGFFPKSDNDDRQNPFSSADFEGAAKCVFNYKYSGFLGQLITFQVDGQLYWTTVAKNSSGNKYSDDIKRIITQNTNPELFEKLIQALDDRKMHLCGETLSFDDQTHGSRYKQEAFIVTGIGYGFYYNFVDNIHEGTSTYSFVTFMELNTMHEFAKYYGLQVDNVFVIENTNITAFLDIMASHRNFATCTSLDAIFKDNADINVFSGTIQHYDVIGDTLEGFIIRIYKADGLHTVKFKFPKYTSVTFGIREMITKDSALWNDHWNNYVDRWVVDDIDGKKYWLQFGNLVIDNYDNLMKDISCGNVGKHICIAEKVSDMLPINIDKKMMEMTVV